MVAITAHLGQGGSAGLKSSLQIERALRGAVFLAGGFAEVSERAPRNRTERTESNRPAKIDVSRSVLAMIEKLQT
jgi:hypothetical protein